MTRRRSEAARRWTMRLAAVAVAAGAIAGTACDRVINLTPPQDAPPRNDGEPSPDAELPTDTLPPPDALEVDAFIVAPDAAVDGAIDSAIDGAAAADEPRR
jgi:hypothetical protein